MPIYLGGTKIGYIHTFVRKSRIVAAITCGSGSTWSSG